VKLDGKTTGLTIDYRLLTIDYSQDLSKKA